MRILSETEVRALAENDLQGGFEACEAAFRYFGEVRDVLSHPSSAFMSLPRDKPAVCRIKGAHLASMGVAGARLATPGYYYCWLTDFEGGQPIALVAEDWLHRRRTATTGALAARWLAGTKTSRRCTPPSTGGCIESTSSREIGTRKVSCAFCVRSYREPNRTSGRHVWCGLWGLRWSVTSTEKEP